MTKKHFIALADILRESTPVDREGLYEQGRRSQHTFIVDRLADFCATQNPNFNRRRWLDYIAGKCGPDGGKMK